MSKKTDLTHGNIMLLMVNYYLRKPNRLSVYIDKNVKTRFFSHTNEALLVFFIVHENNSV